MGQGQAGNTGLAANRNSGLAANGGKEFIRSSRIPQVSPLRGQPWAPDRLEPGQVGEDDVTPLVVPQVEQVARQGSPQVDAGDPGQQGVLETRCEVWRIGVYRQVGVLGNRNGTVRAL